MNTTISTNANGVITRVTVFSHHTFHYGWLAVTLIALAVLAWGLRAVFWNRESN